MSTNKATIILDADSRRLRQELNAVTGQMRRMEADTRKVGQGMTAAFGGLRGVLAGLGVAALVRDAAQAGLALDRMERGLLAATGSAQGAASGMAFVRAEAQRLGLDLASAGQQFAALSAAARGTALEGEGTRDIFSAIAEASTVMGLSTEQTSGALLAIQQIISKGTVSAEELRGQLGERLPGAFQIAARAMGVTTAELGKMLEQGQVVATDFLPRFAVELRKTFGGALPEAVTSSQSAINRFQTAVFEAKAAFARSGFLDGLTEGLAGFGQALSDPAVKDGLAALGQGLGNLIALAGRAAAAFKELAPALGTLGGALAVGRVGATVGSMFGPGGAAVGGTLGMAVGGTLGNLKGRDLRGDTAEPGTGRIERRPPALAPTRPAAPPPAVDPNAAKSAQAAGAANRLRLAREIADAELAIQKDSLQRQATQYQNLLDDRLISVAEFYARKTALDLAQVDAEIARQQQVLDDARAIASGAGTEDDRLRALAQVARAEADLTVLQARRGDVQVANARAATEAETDLRASLDEVKTSVLDLQSALAGGAPQIDLEISLARAQEEYQRILDIARQLQGVERDRAEALAEQFLALSRQQAVVQALQQHAEKLADAQQAAEGITRATIDAGHASGALTDLEALRATGEANRAVLEQLGQIRDAYLAMGEAGATAAAQVQAQMIGLAGQLDPVGAEIRGIFGAALSGFFESFAGESQSWKDRFLGLAGDIVGELQRMFSLELSQQLLKSVSGLFGGQQAEAALAATTLTTGAATAATALGAGAATAGGALGAGGTTAAAALGAGGASAAAAMIAGATSAAAILAGAQAASAAGGSAGLLAGLFHSGGIVGAPGPVLRMPAIAFATAPRYHSGGVAGLAPDEVPAVLRSGEEVLTAADPRHRSNGGLAPAAPAAVNIRNINLFDTQEISNYLASSAGERVVLNIMSRNKAVLA